MLWNWQVREGVDPLVVCLWHLNMGEKSWNPYSLDCGFVSCENVPKTPTILWDPVHQWQRQRSNRTLVLTATGIGSYPIASPLVTVHSQCREKQGSGGGQDRAVHGVSFRVDFLSSSSRNCRNIQQGDGGFYSSWRACGKGQRSKHSGRHLVTHISPPTCVVQVGMLDPSRAVYVLVKSKLDDYVDPITSSFLFTNAGNKSLLGYCYVKQFESMRLRILVKGQ